MTNRLCECGCGDPVRIETNRFIDGHQSRVNAKKRPNSIVDVNKDIEYRFEVYNKNTHYFKFIWMRDVVYVLSKILVELKRFNKGG